MNLDKVLVTAALEDLEERLELIREVLIPDYLDTIKGPDWDLLIDLRTIARAVQTIAHNVAAENRDRIINGWVGGPPSTPPPTGPGLSLPGASG